MKQYSIDETIDVVFSAVEDLIDIGKLSGRTYPSQQIVDLGNLVISKHRIFRSDIWKWMKHTFLQQTWATFKIDFTTAHQEIRDTDATVDELGLSSANEILAQIVDQLRAEVPAEIEQIVTTTPPALQ